MDREHRDWHRLFGLILTDFFTGSPFRVELEKDLSLKKQLLDVVILRREEGPFRERLPDGLEDLAAHNLITFKSYQEALDDWALAVPEGGSSDALHDGRRSPRLRQGAPQGPHPPGDPCGPVPGGDPGGLVPRGAPGRSAPGGH